MAQLGNSIFYREPLPPPDSFIITYYLELSIV